MRRRYRATCLLAALCCLTGCTALFPDRSHDSPPSLLLGTFEDDYGIQYAISEQTWHQLPNATYHIVRWRTDAQYLIAQNDANNPSDAGLWTRIDWIELTEMAPYEWAFCISAYTAPTAAAAEQVTTAQRDTPRTGCNGFPFSRMQPKALENP